MEFPVQTFMLLIAPPAWGKTRLLRHWVSESKYEFLFISPLRALATEVKQQCPEVWVVLPEEIFDLDWPALAQVHPKMVVVWDEIHLVNEWGLTFRHALLEAWYGYCDSGLTGVGFTATLTSGTASFLRETLVHSFEQLLIGDAGNQSFRYPPSHWCWARRTWLAEILLVPLVGRTLIFCHSRQEVDVWVARFFRHGIAAWGVKGGETQAFSQRLLSDPLPAVIVATSCLSHGVNLPSLARVVLLDQAAAPWLLHQMATRAGRRGEPYEVWASWEVGIIPWKSRPRALLRAINRVMMAQAYLLLKAWWHGT